VKEERGKRERWREKTGARGTICFFPFPILRTFLPSVTVGGLCGGESNSNEKMYTFLQEVLSGVPSSELNNTFRNELKNISCEYYEQSSPILVLVLSETK